MISTPVPSRSNQGSAFGTAMPKLESRFELANGVEKSMSCATNWPKFVCRSLSPRADGMLLACLKTQCATSMAIRPTLR